MVKHSLLFILDSVYHPLSKYITPNGQKQTVTLPLSDFATNLRGGKFDMARLKDWTIVNLVPANRRTAFIISNLKLKGGPIGCKVQTDSTSATSPQASGTPSTNQNQKSSAGNSTILVAFTLIALILLFI